jgi:hypothetical protein
MRISSRRVALDGAPGRGAIMQMQLRSQQESNITGRLPQ